MFIWSGFPLWGSRAAGWPFFAMNGPTPKSSATTYLRLATGRGRRYTETVGERLVNPYSGWVLQPVGSRTTSIVNSGSTGVPSARLGGHGRGTRNRPRFKSSECDAASSCGRLGQLLPSIAAKIGSRPFVSRHRASMVSTDTLMPSAG